jgi:hypothetical protein
MNKSAQSIFLIRWFRNTRSSIWSTQALIIFIVGLVLAEFIWWKFFGFEKALEQAIENVIPALACAVVTVFVIAIMQYFKVRQLINIEKHELLNINSQKENQSKIISSWLEHNLNNANIGIAEAYLFGSITHNYYMTNDVDLVLLFKKMSDKKYIKNQSKLKLVESDFYRTFNLKLHIQRYLADEINKFAEFISMQSEPILVIGSDK